MNEQKICIIGDGLTGLTAALMLGKENVKVDLYCNNKKNIKNLHNRTTAISESNYQYIKKKNVVLIEYPRKGIWAVGFATKENEGEIANKVKKKLLNVFVPTTPNPTSGFLLMIPVEDIIYLDMSFEEASKFIVSAGTTNS